MRSFVQYECEKAVKDGLKILVVYNSETVDYSKCPTILWSEGIHINGIKKTLLGRVWNYNVIKKALMLLE